jgi:hypothetical protein
MLAAVAGAAVAVAAVAVAAVAVCSRSCMQPLLYAAVVGAAI